MDKLPTTSQLFEKHFGETAAVGLFHPNIENFFEELNEVCKKEDLLNKKAQVSGTTK